MQEMKLFGYLLFAYCKWDNIFHKLDYYYYYYYLFSMFVIRQNYIIMHFQIPNPNGQEVVKKKTNS